MAPRSHLELVIRGLIEIFNEESANREDLKPRVAETWDGERCGAVSSPARTPSATDRHRQPELVALPCPCLAGYAPQTTQLSLLSSPGQGDEAGSGLSPDWKASRCPGSLGFSSGTAKRSQYLPHS